MTILPATAFAVGRLQRVEKSQDFVAPATGLLHETFGFGTCGPARTTRFKPKSSGAFLKLDHPPRATQSILLHSARVCPMQAEIALSSHASPTQMLDSNSRTQSVSNLATNKFLLTASAESLYAFFFCYQTSSEPWSCPHLWRWNKWVGLSQGGKYARRWMGDCTPALFCFKHPLSQQDENWHDSKVGRLQRLEKNIGFWGLCPRATAKPLDLAHVALLQSPPSMHQQQTLHQNSTRTRGLLVSSHTSPNQLHECKTPAAAFGQQKFFLATNTVAASTDSIYAFFVLVTCILCANTMKTAAAHMTWKLDKRLH